MNVYPEERRRGAPSSSQASRATVSIFSSWRSRNSTTLAHILLAMLLEKKNPATCCSTKKKKSVLCCLPKILASSAKIAGLTRLQPYKLRVQRHVCSHVTITPTFIPLYWRHNSLAIRRAASGADEIGWLGALWLVLLFSRPNSHIQTQLT